MSSDMLINCQEYPSDFPCGNCGKPYGKHASLGNGCPLSAVSFSTTSKFVPANMKTRGQIKKYLDELEKDERVHYAPADISINAPLALIQIDMIASINALRWVLGMLPFKRQVGKK